MSAPNETCNHVADAVQEILDGTMAVLPPDLESHRRQCSACQSLIAAAKRLRFGLDQMPRPTITRDSTQRIVAALIRDRASPAQLVARWKRVLVWAGVAAILMLGAAVVVQRSSLLTAPEKAVARSVPRTVLPERAEPHSLDMRENLAAASDAIVSLTRRTTADVVEPTKDLLTMDMTAPWLKRPDGLPNAIDPASQSFDEVRQGAASGFEPMANSMRRAFAMFTRDLPTDRKPKPDS